MTYTAPGCTLLVHILRKRIYGKYIVIKCNLVYKSGIICEPNLKFKVRAEDIKHWVRYEIE